MDENNLPQIYLKKSSLMNNQNIWIFILIFSNLSHSRNIISAFLSDENFDNLYMKTKFSNHRRENKFTDTTRKQKVSLSTLQYYRCRRREMDEKRWNRKIKKVEMRKSGKVEKYKARNMEKVKVDKSKSGGRKIEEGTLWKSGKVEMRKVDKGESGNMVRREGGNGKV